ncbi:MAG: hypothetical protein ACAH11_06120, partial [Sphingomonas sp.]
MTCQRSHDTRRHLLGGISIFMLAAALLPSNAAAQTRQADSEGQLSVTTVQRAQDAGIAARTLARSVTVATDLVDDTSLEIAGNSVAAAATANAANTELAADP